MNISKKHSKSGDNTMILMIKTFLSSYKKTLFTKKPPHIKPSAVVRHFGIQKNKSRFQRFWD